MPADHVPATIAVTQVDLLTKILENTAGADALPELLARLIEGACTLIGADDGVIGLYCPDEDVVRTAASFNVAPGVLREQVARGEGLIGRVLELNRAIHCRYGDLPHPIRGEALDQEALGIPIMRGSATLGVFCVGVAASRRLAPNAQQLLELYARHAALAITNVQRYTAEQRRASRFALVARIAALIAAVPDVDQLLQRAANAIHELLEFDKVSIPLVDPDDRGTLSVRVRSAGSTNDATSPDTIRIGEGPIGVAAASRRTQRVVRDHAARDDAQSCGPVATVADIAVPIIHAHELLGVLCVAGRAHMDALDRTSLEIIAECLGMALVNARLFDAMRDAALLQERQRLARDLHDNVTQMLASISLLTQSLQDIWPSNQVEAERRVTRLGEVSRLALVEMRALLQELSPVQSSLLSPQLAFDRRLRQLLSAIVPPPVQLHVDIGTFPPTPLNVQEGLLRVCQEAVSNAVRHGHPTMVGVRIQRTERYLRMRVVDDGRGIEPGAPSGMGLANMRQRVAEMRGRLRIRSLHSHGVAILVLVPLTS